MRCAEADTGNPIAVLQDVQVELVADAQGNVGGAITKSAAQLPRAVTRPAMRISAGIPHLVLPLHPHRVAIGQ
jgi:hypothetical protein